LSAQCYWLLRKQGRSARQATNALLRLGTSGKNELLFEHGVNFTRLPNWQKRGIGLYWETYSKSGFNPKSQKTHDAVRRRLRVELDLPIREAYQDFVRARVAEAATALKSPKP
jgi:tRNA(His) guanylyltransferase